MSCNRTITGVANTIYGQLYFGQYVCVFVFVVVTGITEIDGVLLVFRSEVMAACEMHPCLVWACQWSVDGSDVRLLVV